MGCGGSNRQGGLLLSWGNEVSVHQIVSNEFCIKVELKSQDSWGKVWAVFIYASSKE